MCKPGHTEGTTEKGRGNGRLRAVKEVRDYKGLLRVKRLAAVSAHCQLPNLGFYLSTETAVRGPLLPDKYISNNGSQVLGKDPSELQGNTSSRVPQRDKGMIHEANLLRKGCNRPMSDVEWNE